jgi:plastocyanin
MKPLILGALLMAVGTVVVGAELVSAQVAKVSITREESKPKAVEIKAGQEVQFINNTGGQLT